MLKRVLFLNIGANFVLQLLTFAFPLVTLPYVTQIFGASVFGVVSYYGVLAGCFSILAMYGFDHSATRKIPELEGDSHSLGALFAEVQQVKFLLIAISALLFAIFLFFQQPTCEHKAIAWSSFLLTIGAGLNPNWFFQGRMRIQEMVWINSLFKGSALALVFILIKTERDAWLYPTLAALSIIGPALYGIWKTRLSFGIPKKQLKIQTFVRELSDGRWMFGISVLLFLNQSVGVLVLEYWHTMDEVAIYSLGWRFMNVMMAFVLGPIVTSLFPLAGQEIRQAPTSGFKKLIRYMWRILGVLVGLSIPYYFGMTIIFPLLFEEEFAGSLNVFVWLLGVPVLGALTHMLNIQYLVNLHEEKRAFKTLVVASFLGWIWIGWATKSHGVIGATFGSLALEVQVLVAFALVAIRLHRSFQRGASEEL